MSRRKDPVSANQDEMLRPILNTQKPLYERMVHVLQMAYRKHHLEDPCVGWDELDEELETLLCEMMGDRPFQEWLTRHAMET
jgi:hypothetical protein